jgi:hypothetical protein
MPVGVGSRLGKFPRPPLLRRQGCYNTDRATRVTGTKMQVKLFAGNRTKSVRRPASHLFNASAHAQPPHNEDRSGVEEEAIEARALLRGRGVRRPLWREVDLPERFTHKTRMCMCICWVTSRSFHYSPRLYSRSQRNDARITRPLLPMQILVQLLRRVRCT